MRLVGYSTDGPFRCIVYEFMTNGSLEDRLACRVCRFQMIYVILQVSYASIMGYWRQKADEKLGTPPLPQSNPEPLRSQGWKTEVCLE